MARNQKKIPLSTFTALVNKALGLIKNIGSQGIRQQTLLRNMANGKSVVPEIAVADLFNVLTTLGVENMDSTSSNPKWRYRKQALPEVVIPAGLGSVLYPASGVESPVTASVRVVKPTLKPEPVPVTVSAPASAPKEVTMGEVLNLVGPRIRVFLRGESGSVTKAQLLMVAKEALDGRDLPEQFFFRACFYGHVHLKDGEVDTYIKTATGRKKSTKPKVVKSTLRQKKEALAPADVLILDLPPGVVITPEDDRTALNLSALDLNQLAEYMGTSAVITGTVTSMKICTELIGYAARVRVTVTGFGAVVTVPFKADLTFRVGKDIDFRIKCRTVIMKVLIPV